MKKFALLAAFILLPTAALLADPASGAIPSPTPIPVGGKYQGDFPVADRVADAQAFIALSTTTPVQAAGVSGYMENYMLSSATAANWDTPCLWTIPGDSAPKTYSQLAAAIIAAKGFVPSNYPAANTGDLLSKAITVQCTMAGPTNAAQVTAWKAILPNFSTADFTNNDEWQGYGGLLTHYAITAVAAANDAKVSGDFAGAINLLSDPVLTGTNQWVNVIGATATVKYLSRSSDALSWAKLYYIVVGFGDSQAGINMVTGALKAADLNLGRANAFIASQNDPTATITNPAGFIAINSDYTNALKNVALPTAYAGGLPHPEFAPLVDAVIRGQTANAITQGMGAFLAAGDNDSLNRAIGEIARALRDNDLNLIRANGFIAAQKAGNTYPLAELAPPQ